MEAFASVGTYYCNKNFPSKNAKMCFFKMKPSNEEVGGTDNLTHNTQNNEDETRYCIKP